MPDLQPSVPPTNPVPVVLEVLGAEYDFDALGCECADPALQIERWMQESGEPN